MKLPKSVVRLFCLSVVYLMFWQMYVPIIAYAAPGDGDSSTVTTTEVSTDEGSDAESTGVGGTGSGGSGSGGSGDDSSSDSGGDSGGDNDSSDDSSGDDGGNDPVSFSESDFLPFSEFTSRVLQDWRAIRTDGKWKSAQGLSFGDDIDIAGAQSKVQTKLQAAQKALTDELAKSTSADEDVVVQKYVEILSYIIWTQDYAYRTWSDEKGEAPEIVEIDKNIYVGPGNDGDVSRYKDVIEGANDKAKAIVDSAVLNSTDDLANGKINETDAFKFSNQTGGQIDPTVWATTDAYLYSLDRVIKYYIDYSMLASMAKDFDALECSTYNELYDKIRDNLLGDSAEITTKSEAKKVYANAKNKLVPMIRLYNKLVQVVQTTRGMKLKKYDLDGTNVTAWPMYGGLDVSSMLALSPLSKYMVDLYNDALASKQNATESTVDVEVSGNKEDMTDGLLGLMSNGRVVNGMVVCDDGELQLTDLGYVILGAGAIQNPFVSKAGNEFYFEVIKRFITSAGKRKDVEEIIQRALNYKKPIYVTTQVPNNNTSYTDIGEIPVSQYRIAVLADMMNYDSSGINIFAVVKGAMQPSDVDSSTWEYVNGIEAPSTLTTAVASDEEAEDAGDSDSEDEDSEDDGDSDDVEVKSNPDAEEEKLIKSVASESFTGASDQMTWPIAVTCGRDLKYVGSSGYDTTRVGEIGSTTSMLLWNAAQDTRDNTYLKNQDREMLFLNALGDIVLQDNTVVLPAMANPALFTYQLDSTSGSDDGDDELYYGYYPYTVAFMNHYPNAWAQQLDLGTITAWTELMSPLSGANGLFGDSSEENKVIIMQDNTYNWQGRLISSVKSNGRIKVSGTGGVDLAPMNVKSFNVTENTDDVYEGLVKADGTQGSNWAAGLRRFLVRKGLRNGEGMHFFPLDQTDPDVMESYITLAAPLVTSAIRYVSTDYEEDTEDEISLATGENKDGSSDEEDEDEVEDDPVTAGDDDADSTTINKIFWVGDSRFATGGGIADILDSSKEEAIAKVGAGYSWISSYEADGGGGQLTAKLSTDSASAKHEVVIMGFGVNDIDNADKYIELYKELESKYPKTKFYYMSVNPVVEGGSGVDSGLTNEKIEAFNTKLKTFAGSKYINTYTDLKEKLTLDNSSDGVHYNSSINQEIYDTVTEKVEAKFKKSSGSSGDDDEVYTGTSSVSSRFETGTFDCARYVEQFVAEGLIGTAYSDTIVKNYKVSYEDIVEDTGNRFQKFLNSIASAAVDNLGRIDGVMSIKNGYENGFFNIIMRFVQKFYLIFAAVLMIIVAVRFIKQRYSMAYILVVGLCVAAGFQVYANWMPTLVPSIYNFFVNDFNEPTVWTTVANQAEAYDETYADSDRVDASTQEVKPYTSTITLYKLTDSEMDELIGRYGLDDDVLRDGTSVMLDKEAGIFVKGNTIKMSLDKLFANNSMRGLYKSQWEDVSTSEDTEKNKITPVETADNNNPYSIQLVNPYTSMESYYMPFPHFERAFMQTLNDFASIFMLERRSYSVGTDITKDAFIVNAFINSGIFLAPGRDDILEMNIQSTTADIDSTVVIQDIIDICNDTFYPQEDWLNLRTVFEDPSEAMRATLWMQMLKRRGFYDENWIVDDTKITQLILYINTQTKKFVLDNVDLLAFCTDENAIKLITLYAVTAFTHKVSEFGYWLYPNYINTSDIELKDIMYGCMTTLRDKNFANDGTVVNTVALNNGAFGVILLTFITILSVLFVFILNYLVPVLYACFGGIIIYKILNVDDSVGVVKGYVKTTAITVLLYFLYSVGLRLIGVSGYNWYGFLGCLLVTCLCLYIMFFVLLSVVQNFSELGNDAIASNLMRAGDLLTRGAISNLRARNFSVNRTSMKHVVASFPYRGYRRSATVDDFNGYGAHRSMGVGEAGGARDVGGVGDYESYGGYDEYVGYGRRQRSRFNRDVRRYGQNSAERRRVSQEGLNLNDDVEHHE